MTEILSTLTAGSRPRMQHPARTGVGGTEDATRLTESSEKAERLKKACEDMEALFIHQLLKEMRATIPKSGLLGKSQAQDIYTGMLDGRLAQEISQNRGLGLSTLLMRQLGAAERPPDENSR